MEKFNPNFYLDAADDSEMIQAAVDAAKEFGEKVVIPRKNMRTGKNLWILPRAIKVYSGTTICIDNAHLRQADESFDNIFKTVHVFTEEAKKLENRLYDIHIYGVGNAVLDGGNHNGITELNQLKDGRPRVVESSPIHFTNAERIVIENLRIVNQRYWGMCFQFCSSGRISNIHFMSNGLVPNQDGIDLRSGCNSFIIENITGYTGDDTVALTALRNLACQVENMDDSIHDVIIRNITSCTTCAQVRLLNHWGKKLYNVIIENVQSICEYDPCDERSAGIPIRIPLSDNYYMDSSKTTCAVPKDEIYWYTFDNDERRPIVSVRIGDAYYFDPNDPTSIGKKGDTYNITVRNVQSRAMYPLLIAHTLCDSYIDNIQAFGDAISAIYFEKGEYDNIRVDGINYTASSKRRNEKDGGLEGEQVPVRPLLECSTVYFNGPQMTNMRFNSIVTSKTNTAVFAGSGDIDIKARDIIMRCPETKLVSGKGIRVKVLD